MLTWLTSTIGQTVAKWTSIVAIAVAVYWKIYADGQAAEKATQLARDAAAAKDREKIDDHVSKMDDVAVRDELARWVRHD
ncbi:hypothetical protein [Pararhizobium sp.]|uniref:hypothetical protein n=1 Tax=Pararhizobium sp. TaxID=1977563 RepID=UPI003D0D50C6